MRVDPKSALSGAERPFKHGNRQRNGLEVARLRFVLLSNCAHVCSDVVKSTYKSLPERPDFQVIGEQVQGMSIESLVSDQ